MHATSLPVQLSTLSSQLFPRLPVPKSPTLPSPQRSTQAQNFPAIHHPSSFTIPPFRPIPTNFIFQPLNADGFKFSFATPGYASLHPGLLSLNPFGVAFQQYFHRGRSVAGMPAILRPQRGRTSHMPSQATNLKPLRGCSL